MTGLEPLLVAGIVGSTAVSAVGSMVEGNARNEAAQENAASEERNRVLADQDRRTAVETGLLDAEDRRRENKRTLSALRASFGTSGVDLASSPLDVLEDTAVEAELDAQRVEYEARARNREGAANMVSRTERARNYRREGANSLTAGFLGALGAVAGGASRLARVS